MQEAHYQLVSDKFDLEHYNRLNVWSWRANRDIQLTYYRVEQQGIFDFMITDPRAYFNVSKLVSGIPTRELAEEILQYFRDTEILFI